MKALDNEQVTKYDANFKRIQLLYNYQEIQPLIVNHPSQYKQYENSLPLSPEANGNTKLIGFK